MAIKLITGTRPEQNVKSEDDGARLYGTISTGDRVLNVSESFGYEVISNNTVRIKAGEALIQGRHVRQTPGTYTDLTIDNGTQGQKRYDIIVLRYTKDNGTDIENAELAVIKGTPGATAKMPAITTGDVYTGCLLHEMPLYRVYLNGLNIVSVTQLFKTLGTLDKILDLVYPVGSIYMSVNSTNPVTLFGGTWEMLKDRFLLGAGNTYAAGGTGGERDHTLTVDEMPKHTHHGQGSGAGWASGHSGSISNAIMTPGTSSSTQLWFFDDTTTSSTGGNAAHNNMPPYLVVYMWKRTA